MSIHSLEENPHVLNKGTDACPKRLHDRDVQGHHADASYAAYPSCRDAVYCTLDRGKESVADSK